MSREIRERQPLSNNKVHDHPLLNRIYTNRGVSCHEDLEYSLSKILSPWLMMDMDKAVETIIHHIKNKSNILIVGDYDCDGATSTTIAIEGLYMCGASQVDFIVPDRQIHGYGLAPLLVKEIESKYKPDLIITVDNGISAFDGANAVAEMSHPCDLLITDHHLADPTGLLPNAKALVNPNRIDCKFPSKDIAGCGVIFYVIMALRNRMSENHIFEELGLYKPDIRYLLDVLALGTVADVVTLDENNRILVKAGLDRMNSGQIRYGLKAILDIANKKVGELVASDMGFAIGPRINAAGRMSDMSIGIRCLLANNPDTARSIASELDALNSMRKNVEIDMVNEANLNINFDDSQFGITILGENFHEGVVGIVAARIKEKFNRPVICFTNTEDINGEPAIKGSARSVKGVHLKHALLEIKALHPNMFEKFGGHAMAAGLSIKAKDFNLFSQCFNEIVKKNITSDILSGLIEVDIMDFDERYLSIETAKLIEQGGPWGQNFEEPVFESKFIVTEEVPMGDKENPKHLRLLLQKNNASVQAVWFNSIPDTGYTPLAGEVSAIFTLSVNRFRGNEKLQLMIKHIEPIKNNHNQNEHIDVLNNAEPSRGGYRVPSLTSRKADTLTSCSYISKEDIINKVLN